MLHLLYIYFFLEKKMKSLSIQMQTQLHILKTLFAPECAIYDIILLPELALHSDVCTISHLTLAL